MQMLARGYLVYDITGSASRLGIVAAASAFPMLALALFGGAIADRVERKKLIQIGQFIVGALALLVGILIATGRIEWYYLLTVAVIQGAVWALTMPARQALIPQIVGPEKITNAMALNSAGMSAMTLLAPAVAGGLYALAGPEYVYFVIATMSLVAMGLTTRIEPPEQSGSAKKRPLLNEIGEGLTYIRGNSLVLVLLLVGLATTMLHAPFMSLLPVFVVDVYHRGPDSMGLLVAIMGAGALVGSLAVAAMGAWRRGILLLVGAFSTGIALALVAAIPFYAAAAAIMLLMGLGDAGRRTINMGLMMEVSDDRYRGRVMSVFMMNFGLMPLERAARWTGRRRFRRTNSNGGAGNWADSDRGMDTRDPKEVAGVGLAAPPFNSSFPRRRESSDQRNSTNLVPSLLYCQVRNERKFIPRTPHVINTEFQARSLLRVCRLQLPGTGFDLSNGVGYQYRVQP